MAIISSMNDSSFESLISTITPEGLLIFFLISLGILLLWGIVYLMVKIGEVVEIKKKYYQQKIEKLKKEEKE